MRPAPSGVAPTNNNMEDDEHVRCPRNRKPSTLAGVNDEYAVPVELVKNYASKEVGVYPASAIASRMSSIVD